MNLKNKIYLTALISSLSGCNNDTSPPDVAPSEYITCKTPAYFEKDCFDDYEVRGLEKANITPEEANPLRFLSASDIVFIKLGQGCDLRKYASLLQHLGDSPGKQHYYSPLIAALCSEEVTVDNIDAIVSSYPSCVSEWEAVILYHGRVDGNNVCRYAELRHRFSDLKISEEAIIGFERDIKAGKTTYEEIEKLLRQEELMRGVRR